MSQDVPTADVPSEEVPSADLTFEQKLARQQRRNLIIGVAVGFTVAVGIVGAVLFWPKPPEPRCKDSDVRAFLDQREIPVAAVYMVCKFPGPLKAAFRDMAAAPPRHRLLVLLKTVAENRSLITRVCPRGVDAIVQTSRELPARHAALYLERCDLAKLGIASQGALQGASLEHLILATILYGVLKDSDPKWAKRLAREVCCSGRRP